MSTNDENKNKISTIESELYLLIAKFLSTGPCKESAKVLREEIERHQLLPKRVDWHGNEHSRTFNELDNLLSQIADDHLLKICSRIGPILDKEIPPTVPGLTSLLGVGRQSFLRTKEDLQKPKCQISNLIARKNGMPLLPSQAAQSAYPPNIAQVLMSRELSGSLSTRHTFTPKIYARQQNYRRLLGHLSSVYCVLYDRTGKYIFTGADDLLVKIWSAIDGRLLASLRGHSAEITDMAVNYENTLLAAGSCDKTIRVWCLRTTAPVAVLNAHTGMVTSLQFCPYPKKEDHLLISTGNDGCVCFWQWNPKNNSFNPKPLKFTERNKPGAQMVCSSFSKGGLFLATGSTDHNVRVYNIAGSNGPEKILEKEAHTDRVDSLQFSNSDCRFITGSKDGTASIWQYRKQAWTSIQLKMTTKLPGQSDEPEDVKTKLRVTMVGWTLDDSRVITAVSDYSIKIWDSNSGALRFVLKGHEDEVFVLEPHPIDPRVFLSSGHDGRIILWDLVTGTIIKNHFNLIEGQGHGAVFDCKFSPDGLSFASTDSHGHISIFGFGAADRYKKVPEEQFFHTDYRPLIRDIHHHVLDEQTQTAPHLLPPPFLVDIDGNPYPPQLQRLVPGREHCNDSQLVPYVAVSADGDSEILEPVRSANDAQDRPTIDDMIERLQLEQNQNQDQRDTSSENGSRRGPPDSPRSPNSSRRVPNDNDDYNAIPDPFSPRTPRSQAAHSRVGLRRTGESEGVQTVGNWQSRGGNQTELPSWVKRVIVKPMKLSLSHSHLRTRLSFAEHELSIFNRERKWRPPPEPVKEFQNRSSGNASGLKRPGLRAGTRARTQEDAVNSAFGEDFENPDNVQSSAASETEQEEEDKEEDAFTDSSESASGEYSDWEEDAGKKKRERAERSDPPEAEPSASTSSRPVRTRRRPRILSDEDREEETADDTEDLDENTEEEKESPSSKGQEKSSSRMTRRNRKRLANGKKLPERFRPPEWLTDVMPHKAPYLPQIGDEIMYFRQGHELYVQAVKRNRAYEIYMRDQPWRKCNIRDQEVAIIEDITFENHPPRLCCLKLALTNPASKHDDTFTVKYHDMEDVIEFIILKQNYDQAMYYDWKQGDRFRSAIDKAWWLGTIKAQKPLNPRFPDSMFQCFVVRWDNGEREQMSPWDFERVDAERLPSFEGGSVDILPEERLQMMYIPEPHEWSVFGRDHECDRIGRGLTRIMELSIAEPFITPVDLNVYPSYAIVVEYPMDLGTIKARLLNRFYRRLAAIKFDVQYIGINALKFNEPTSRIVKQAKCVVDLCVKFMGSPNCNDPMVFYQEMMEAKQSRSQDSQSELDVLCSESDSDGERNAKMKRKKRNALQSSKRMQNGNQKYTSSSWREQCISLINSMFQWDDSTPFRYPVNLNDYPNYRDIIDCPMDLSTVRDRLNNNYYSSPTDLCKDMRLIFQNSRTYNINKKSRIYSMTIRLSAMFEEHIRGIASDWKSAVKYEEKIRNNQYVSNRRKPLLVQEADVNVGASTSRGFSSNLPSTSRGDTHRASMNRILNAAFSDPSGSRRKLSNGTGRKKKSRHDVSPSKSMLKKKRLKPISGNSLTNGSVKKKSPINSKQKIPETPTKRSDSSRKTEPSSLEGSHTDSEATNHSNNSSDSDSDGSEWGNSRRKKRPKDFSESEGSVYRSKSKRPRKEPSTLISRTRTFRSATIKKHLRRTRATSSFHRKSSRFLSSVRSLNRSAQFSNPSSSRSVTPDKVTRKAAAKAKSSLGIRSKTISVSSPPSKRAHLRRVTVQPQRYANSGTTSESDASASNSSKADSNSNSPTSTSNSRSTSISQVSSGKLPSTRSSRTINEPPVDESPNYSSGSESEEQAKPATQPKRMGRSALHVPSPRQTRNRGQRTVQYGEDSDADENYDSGNSQPLLSLSSRGRLRALGKGKNQIQPVIKKESPQKTSKKDSFRGEKVSPRHGENKSFEQNVNSRRSIKNIVSNVSSEIRKGRKFKSLPLTQHKFPVHSSSGSLRSRSTTRVIDSESKNFNFTPVPCSSGLLKSKVEKKLLKGSQKICDKEKFLKSKGYEYSSTKKNINDVAGNRSESKLKKYNLIKKKATPRLTRSSLSGQNFYGTSNSTYMHARSRIKFAKKEEKLSGENFSHENGESVEIKPISEGSKTAHRTSDDSLSNAKSGNARKSWPTTKRKSGSGKSKNTVSPDHKPSKSSSVGPNRIYSYTRSAVHKEGSSAPKNETHNEFNSHSKSDIGNIKDKLTSQKAPGKKEDPGCSKWSKENSRSAASKRKWYQRKIRTAARISTRVTQTSGKEPNKRETRYSGRRTVLYTEDIDSPYLMEMFENEDNYESDSQKSSQSKEILTSSTNVPLSETVLTNARKRRSYVQVKHKPGNLKKYPLRTDEVKKPLKQLSNGIETRNRGERTMLYDDESDLSDEFENLEPTLLNRSCF